MAAKKIKSKWIIDIRPNGKHGKRIIRKFDTKAEALRFEAFAKASAVNEPWNPKAVDKRRLSELARIWFDGHGKHLKSGAKRMTEINKLVDLLGDPLASEFKAADFVACRSRRLDSVSINTVNHDLTNLNAIFNELIRSGEWLTDNPLKSVRKLKQDERELEYLTLEQIDELLAVLDDSPYSHARVSARICLATGARWGEACKVKASQVRAGKIHFSGTKSGKNRSVPIDDELARLIRDHAPLVDGMNTFKRAVAKLGFELPKGQMTHILRHTFASHFVMNGGNIVTLQRILGHGSLAMTIRYAHLAPEHLEEALKLNPLASQ